MSTDTTPREVRFWDCSDDKESLCWTSITEAVEQWADEQHPNPLPETVTVYGFASMELPPLKHLADEALERMLELLDEDYGDPTDSGTTPTPGMRDAALRFANSICIEYDPWACEQVTEEVVRVADHVPASWMHPEGPRFSRLTSAEGATSRSTTEQAGEK